MLVELFAHKHHAGGNAAVEVVSRCAALVNEQLRKFWQEHTQTGFRLPPVANDYNEMPRLNHADARARVVPAAQAVFAGRFVDNAVLHQHGAEGENVPHAVGKQILYARSVLGKHLHGQVGVHRHAVLALVVLKDNAVANQNSLIARVALDQVVAGHEQNGLRIPRENPGADRALAVAVVRRLHGAEAVLAAHADIRNKVAVQLRLGHEYAVNDD